MRQFTFADLTDNQLKFIETIKIGDMFISAEHIDEVTDVLNLNGKSESELRAIRNTVVRHLNDKFDEIRDDRDRFEEACQIRINISGVTCVIDNILFNIGCEV